MSSSGGEARPIEPDYSHVTSRELASQLVQRGELVPTLMLPEMFGGDPKLENIVFLPPFAAELKMRIDGEIILPLVDCGTVIDYRVEPTYSGASLVPTVLGVIAQHPENFIYKIVRVWGNGSTQVAR